MAQSLWLVQQHPFAATNIGRVHTVLGHPPEFWCFIIKFFKINSFKLPNRFNSFKKQKN
jgi:hypothetical protein